jgi:hypothetical protein
MTASGLILGKIFIRACLLNVNAPSNVHIFLQSAGVVATKNTARKDVLSFSPHAG